MNTVAGLREVAHRVAADGFPVEFVPGWETRGRGTLTPRGAVNHWTAGPRTGNTPSLRIVTHGRAGLRNALCNTYSSREPRLYIVAARTAWHAGKGSWQGTTGNSRMLGHEAENSGQGEWTPRHLDLIAALDRAQIDVFGFGVSMVCDHYEWTPRKIDRRDVGGPPWRARVATAPAPAQEDDMKYTIVNERGTPHLWAIGGTIGKAPDENAIRQMQAAGLIGNKPDAAGKWPPVDRYVIDALRDR